MKVATKAYGPIEVDERQKLSFPQGLLGFESFREYILLEAERQPFYWLQSLDLEDLAFIVINPFLFRPDYEINIDNQDLEDIGITDPGGALVFTVVTMPDEGPITANLQGPLVINRDTRSGIQVVLSDPRWKVKHDLLAELAKGDA